MTLYYLRYLYHMIRLSYDITIAICHMIYHDTCHMISYDII